MRDHLELECKIMPARERFRMDYVDIKFGYISDSSGALL